MNFVHYHPWPAGRLQVFSRFFGDNDQPSQPASQWAPRVDIKEEDRRFVILADIPGVDPAAIEISADKNVLTIKGERKSEGGEDGKVKRVERAHGAFLRSFTLPDNADVDAISASGRHGVLEITIPKKAEAAPRKIEIKH